MAADVQTSLPASTLTREHDALLVPVQVGRRMLFVRAALPGVKIAQKAEYIWCDGREGAVDKASGWTCQLAG